MFSGFISHETGLLAVLSFYVFMLSLAIRKKVSVWCAVKISKSLEGYPYHIWTSSGLSIFPTAVQRYALFLYLQTFLQLFLHFFATFFKNGLRGHSEAEKNFTYIRQEGRKEGREKSRILQPI